ncbi:Peptidase M13 [Quaeritorhiza haematococci]|nr:Peptidase M13 [Quaeritorhiza haematococci]
MRPQQQRIPLALIATASVHLALGLPVDEDGILHRTNIGWEPSPDARIAVPFAGNFPEEDAKVISGEYDFTELSSFMDTMADPCSDFYQFACGGFQKKYPLPAGRPRYGSFDLISDRNKAAIKDILYGKVEVPVNGDQDRKNLETVRGYFESCLKGNQGSGTLAGFMLKEGIRDSAEKLTPTKLARGMAFTRSNLNTAPFFTTYLEASPVTKENKLSIAVYSRTFLLNLQQYKNQAMVDAAKAYARDIARMLGLHLESGVELEAFADGVLELEKGLAAAAFAAQESEDEKEQEMSLEELQKAYPGLDWKAYFETQGYGSGDVPAVTKVSVAMPSYMKVLTETLQKIFDSGSTSAIQNYVVLNAVFNAAPFMGSELQAPWERFQKLVNPQFVPPSVNREGFCLDMLNSGSNSGLGFMSGSFFVRQAFGGDSKSQILEMIENIRVALEKRFQRNQWMDKKTKANAIEKLQAIKNTKIGFPDYITDPNALAARYAGVSVNTTNFFATAVTVSRANFRTLRLQPFGKPSNSDADFGMPPSTVNAYYSPQVNEIAFPAGILQPPFFSAKNPAMMNYAAIGSVIGHEITHAFDNNGRKTGPNGEEIDWWTPEDDKQFTDLSQCFVSQYSNFTVPDGNNSTLHLNGKNTLGENIADNGGTAIALDAWKRAGKGAPSHVYVPSPISKKGLRLNRAQLFFVAYGQAWCSNATPQFTADAVESDVHSPPRFRVLGTLQNSEAFAKAFQCGAGTPMNPEKKCYLW